MFPKSRKNCLRRAESGFSFFDGGLVPPAEKLLTTLVVRLRGSRLLFCGDGFDGKTGASSRTPRLVRGMEGQAGPSIQNAEEFANNV